MTWTLVAGLVGFEMDNMSERVNTKASPPPRRLPSANIEDVVVDENVLALHQVLVEHLFLNEETRRQRSVLLRVYRRQGDAEEGEHQQGKVGGFLEKGKEGHDFGRLG